MIVQLLPLYTPEPIDHPRNGTKHGSDAWLSSSTDPIIEASQNTDTEALVNVVNQIEDVLSQQHSFERLVALYETISQLESRSLKHLLSQSSNMEWNISDQSRSDLQTVLVERLATTDPQDAIDFVLNQDFEKFNITPSLVSTIVDSSKSELENVATRFTPSAEVSRTLAYRVISKNQPHMPFKRKREIATQLDLETDFMRLFLNSSSVAILEDIQQIGSTEINNVLEDFDDVPQLIEVLTRWYHNRGVEILHHMRTTLNNDEVAEIIQSVVLEHVATERPAYAFEYALSELSRDTHFLASEEVIQQWAAQDPSAAFAAVNDLDTGALKKQLQYSVIYYWATKDPVYVLENLSNFPPHTQIDGASNAIGALASDSPEQAVAWVIQMKDVNMLRPVAITLLSVWSRTDLKAVYEWVLHEPAIASVREHLYEPLAYGLVATDPQGALEIAQKHPLATGQVGVEARIFRAIAFQDIQVALDLLPNVRAAQKNFAYGAVGSVYVQSQDFEKAVDLGLQLDESAQADYYQYISYIWVNTDANKLYEILPSLPNEEARSKAAYALLVLNDNNDYFTEQQGEVLDQYLTAKDREILGPLAPLSSP